MWRDVGVCKQCEDNVVDGVIGVVPEGELRRRSFVVDPHRYRASGDRLLGHPLSVCAPPLAELTDFEEMVLSLVHPLVQVYTIPSTGELAYVGHVCNFRQHVTEFLSTLPVRPEKVPIVIVRPRRKAGSVAAGAGDPAWKPRKAHQVRMACLRRAFGWLKENNALYAEVEWDEGAQAHYYYNSETEEQTWEKPEELMPVLALPFPPRNISNSKQIST